VARCTGSLDVDASNECETAAQLLRTSVEMVRVTK